MLIMFQSLISAYNSMHNNNTMKNLLPKSDHQLSSNNSGTYSENEEDDYFYNVTTTEEESKTEIKLTTKKDKRQNETNDTWKYWSDPNFYIEVDRDYSLAKTNGIRFSRVFPSELNGAVTPIIYANTISVINAIFEQAESVSWTSTLESILWTITFELMGYCRKSRLEKAMIKVHEFLYTQNETIYHPIGLHFVHPIVLNLLGIGIRNISKYQLYINQDEEDI